MAEYPPFQLASQRLPLGLSITRQSAWRFGYDPAYLHLTVTGGKPAQDGALVMLDLLRAGQFAPPPVSVVRIAR